jgi:hypothetical protein
VLAAQRTSRDLPFAPSTPQKWTPLPKMDVMEISSHDTRVLGFDAGKKKSSKTDKKHKDGQHSAKFLDLRFNKNSNAPRPPHMQARYTSQPAALNLGKLWGGLSSTGI